MKTQNDSRPRKTTGIYKKDSLSTTGKMRILCHPPNPDKASILTLDLTELSETTAKNTPKERASTWIMVSQNLFKPILSFKLESTSQFQESIHSGIYRLHFSLFLTSFYIPLLNTVAQMRGLEI